VKIAIVDLIGYRHILHFQRFCHQCDHMVLDVRIIPARNFLVILHNRINTVLALHNIQTARKWVRRFLYAKGFQMKIRNLLIAGHCIIEIPELLNFHRIGLQIRHNIELLHKRLFRLPLLFNRKFFAVHIHKPVQHSRMTAHDPVGADIAAPFSLAGGVCPFLITVRIPSVVVVIIQCVRQNIAHALHAELFNNGFCGIICKVHSVKIVCNRFFNGVSALFIELSGNAVQIHLTILCRIAERFVIDRNI